MRQRIPDSDAKIDNIYMYTYKIKGEEINHHP